MATEIKFDRQPCVAEIKSEIMNFCSMSNWHSFWQVEMNIVRAAHGKNELLHKWVCHFRSLMYKQVYIFY